MGRYIATLKGTLAHIGAKNSHGIPSRSSNVFTLNLSTLAVTQLTSLMTCSLARNIPRGLLTGSFSRSRGRGSRRCGILLVVTTPSLVTGIRVPSASVELGIFSQKAQLYNTI